MSYESYEKMKEEFAERHKGMIAQLKKDETPQYILMAKTISDKLEDDKAYTRTMSDEFGFSERMVNRLMHFAYMLGSSDIDHRSYETGKEDARKEMAKFLGYEENE